jgi:hypothetical protein
MQSANKICIDYGGFEKEKFLDEEIFKPDRMAGAKDASSIQHIVGLMEYF